MSEYIKSPETSSAQDRSEQYLRSLGRNCLATQVDSTLLAQHQSLVDNPNSFGASSLFATGDISTEADKIYRQVDISAIEDLAKSGIVRNGATASGGVHRRWGHKVFWNSGKEGTAVNVGDRAVIVASKKAAGEGWITNKDVHSINVKTDSGEIINILQQ